MAAVGWHGGHNGLPPLLAVRPSFRMTVSLNPDWKFIRADVTNIGGRLHFTPLPGKITLTATRDGLEPRRWGVESQRR